MWHNRNGQKHLMTARTAHTSAPGQRVTKKTRRKKKSQQKRNTSLTSNSYERKERTFCGFIQLAGRKKRRQKLLFTCCRTNYYAKALRKRRRFHTNNKSDDEEEALNTLEPVNDPPNSIVCTFDCASSDHRRWPENFVLAPYDL